MTPQGKFCVWARILLLLAVAAAGAALPEARAQPVDEEKAAKVKSAYLVNFLRFSEWPDSAFSNPGDPVVIVVLGEDPLGAALDAVAREVRVDDRPVAVRRLQWPDRRSHRRAEDFDAAVAQTVEAIRQGHLLLLSDSLRDQGGSILKAVGDAPVLTVGDGETWMQFGAALALELERGKIVFHANPRAIKTLSVSVSSRLLSLAKLYER